MIPFTLPVTLKISPQISQSLNTTNRESTSRPLRPLLFTLYIEVISSSKKILCLVRRKCVGVVVMPLDIVTSSDAIPNEGKLNLAS